MASNLAYDGLLAAMRVLGPINRSARSGCSRKPDLSVITSDEYDITLKVISLLGNIWWYWIFLWYWVRYITFKITYIITLYWRLYCNNITFNMTYNNIISKVILYCRRIYRLLRAGDPKMRPFATSRYEQDVVSTHVSLCFLLLSLPISRVRGCWLLWEC